MSCAARFPLEAGRVALGRVPTDIQRVAEQDGKSGEGAGGLGGGAGESAVSDLDLRNMGLHRILFRVGGPPRSEPPPEPPPTRAGGVAHVHNSLQRTEANGTTLFP